ncbi:Receptor-like protein 1 [Cardamine amara subsp. amara]|uniref:Receptor-like protein 1 n=1 Tax=Cardamine amara subsp. amara TaxID=228776 RepID=A0ABD1A599_CARAN
MRTYERRWWWVKSEKQMALVVIIVIVTLQFQTKGCVGCLENERVGLLELKSYLNSLLSPKEESILKSWIHGDLKSDCCHWERVNCSDSIGGHIVDLSLNQIMPGTEDWVAPRPLNLSLLHSFPQLKSLDFSWNWFNHLFDPIHGYKSLQRLEKLRTLDFLGNRFNISVLPFLSAARSLRTLNLGNNLLIGAFPPNELASMPELRVLNLEWNGFMIFSVQGLINFRELEVLNLSENSINNIEAGDGLRTTKLKTLDLSYNQFSGAAPLKGLEYFVELKVLRLMGNLFDDTRSIQGFVFPSSLQVLDLHANRLSLTPRGYSEICRLMHLRELDLSQNALTSMPYCLRNLTRLRTLDLSDNQLNGNLSSFVFGLPSALEYLSLLANDFNGSFWFNSLVNHTRLTVFKLSSRVGMIPDHTERSWVPLFQLKMLKLQNFIIGNAIPGFLVHQHDLCFIDISYSQLTGSFPAWLLQNNTRLQTMLLNNNSLTELQLPRLVHGLQVLDISSNRIHGSVQKDIGIVFPNLMYMKLDSNHFHGTIPSSMSEMKSLQFLDMSSNNLSGQLPITFLSSCYSLNFLKLSNNQLQGKILPEHANLTGLAWLALNGNNFSGSLGKGLLNSKNLYLIDISNNSFSGTLPLWIGRISSLSYLYMRGNQLKGLLPRQLQNLQQLKVIDISQNRFSGSIPRNVYFPSLVELRLHGNAYMGTIPDTLYEAKELEVLDLRNNNFSGKILNTIGKSSNLRVLLLRNNSLQSHIPEKICQLLSKVGLLDLSHNKFKGGIPSCLGNMSFSEPSDFNNFPQYLQGNSYFIDITHLQHCGYESAITGLGDDFRMGDQPTPATTVDFSTKNRYEAYEGNIIRNMHGLDLSSNQLSGEIPVEIGNLHNIRSLNLSSNCLIGSIPESISKLKDLESLDLSNNKLHGNIPPQLAELNNLGFFNVSYNNLSGEIPIKGHLLTFQEMSYIGNAHLCGLPTNKICNPMRLVEPNVSKQAKEEEEEGGDGMIDMVWFYWTCGAVYISTSLALFAFLYIESRWSREWFYQVDLFVHHLQRLKGHCN